MTGPRSADYLRRLVRELCQLCHKTGCVEFENNDAAPQAEAVGEGVIVIEDREVGAKVRRYLPS